VHRSAAAKCPIVDDVDASAQKATELGGTIMVPPMDIKDVGRFSVIRDPQGAVFSIITYLKK
jgi:predicted enzyme related to lactoylglutathione lyase